MPYSIEPCNEPRGEGNGWNDCADHEAKLFRVFRDDEEVAAFETRAQAEQYVKAWSA